MPDYTSWTRAIYQTFTEGIPYGESVLLSLTPDKLAEIGASTSVEPDEGWVENFCEAVRQFCTRRQRVNLEPLIHILLPRANGAQEDLCPIAVGWLAFQVLAAQQMHQDEKLSLANYYSRLRKLLRLPGKGLPYGMENRQISLLWEEWNHWLTRKGWQPTAFEKSGPQRFISLPLSQCLLRQGEMDRLSVLSAPRRLNRQQLFSWLQLPAQFNQLPLRLQKQFQGPFSSLLSELIYDLYLDERFRGQSLPFRSAHSRLQAGLWRKEDYIWDSVTYHVYPRQRREQIPVPGFRVQTNQGLEPLQNERAGWYSPLQIEVKELLETQSWPIIGAAQKELILPGSPVWVLIRDPLAPDASSFATWGKPKIGEPFILLLHEVCTRELSVLEECGLLSLSGRTGTCDSLGPQWTEYYDCELLETEPHCWQAAQSQAPQLCDVLQPDMEMSLLMQDGLRAPRKGGWLVEIPPKVCLIAPPGEYTLLVSQRNEQDLEIYAERIKLVAREPVDLNWPGVGHYLLSINGYPRLSRSVRLWDWADLPNLQPEKSYAYALETGEQIQGALIRA